MPTIGKLAIIVSANADQAMGVMEQLEAKLGSLQGAAGGGGGVSSALSAGPLGFVAGAAGGAMVAAAQALGSALESVVSKVQSAASALFNLGKSAVKTAADFEQARMSFGNMLGSAEAGAKFFDELAARAAVTPFKLTDLTQASQRLLAFGFSAKDTTTILEKMGDVAASMPGGAAEGLQRITLALGQMAAKGKASGEEMRQLAEAGVDAIPRLAKMLGVSTAQAIKMMEAGAVSARQGILAILSMGDDPRFKGSQEKLSQSLNGLWSTIQDNAELAMGDLGAAIAHGLDLSGVATQAIDFLGMLRKNVDALEPSLRVVGEIFRTTLEAVTTFGESGIAAMADWLRGVDSSATAMEDWRTVTLNALEMAAKGVSLIADSLQAMYLAAKVAVQPLVDLFNWLTSNQSVIGAFKDMGFGQHFGAIEGFFDKLHDRTGQAKNDAAGMAGAFGQDLARALEQAAKQAGKLAEGLDFGKGVSAFAPMMEQLQTPLEAFGQKLQQLQRMLAEDAANGINSMTIFGRAAAAEVEKLKKAIGWGPEKLPTAMEANSREAVSAIIRAQNSDRAGDARTDIQQQIKNIMEQAKEFEKRTANNTERTAKALEKFIIPVAKL